MAGSGSSGKEKLVKPLGWLWLTGLTLGILACVPSMLETLCAKTYATHRHGVAVVTGASSPLGKAAVEALIEDGYVVRATYYVGRKKENQSGTPLCGSFSGRGLRCRAPSYRARQLFHCCRRARFSPTKPEPQHKQVYGGVKTEADADQLVQAVGTTREGALRPLVLDVSKPESLPAVVAKVKAELGTVRSVVEWKLLWVLCDGW